MPANEQRKDIDEMMNRHATLHKLNQSVLDEVYGNITKSFTDYEIYVAGKISNMSDNWVKHGLLRTGDMTVTFRYEYSSESTGLEINPAIAVVIHDEITINGTRFHVDGVTEVVGCDDNIICYEGRLVRMI